MLALAAPALAADSATDETTLIFDLAGESSVVDQHHAQMLWNLKTDNIAAEWVGTVTGWNSLYIEERGMASGRVIVDLDAGTITGDFSELWVCNNDCVTPNGTPSWTTTRDTGWTATIVDGSVVPEAAHWAIIGTVAIKYKATVTSVESPSDCNGSPCYICQNQLCEIGDQATAVAELEGWIDGDRLSLFFVDQLAADATTMELSDLRRTEYFMSRFSFTMTGVVPPVVAEPPPEEPAEEPIEEPSEDELDLTESDTPTLDAGDPETAADDFGSGDDAGSPPMELSEAAGTFESDTAGPKTPAAISGDVLIAILSLILSGVAVVLIAGYLIRTLMGWNKYDAAVDTVRAEDLEVTHDKDGYYTPVLQNATRDLPDAPPPAETLSPTKPGGTPAADAPLPPAVPLTTPPPKEPQSQSTPTIEKTPSAHYATRPGLRSGRYRSVEFTEPVRVERQGSGTTVEIVDNKFTGPALLGDPDPAAPWRTWMFGNDGTPIGWVRTSDVPD